MNKELSANWLKAKKAEEKAKKQRIEIEKEMESLIPEFEGLSKAFKADGFKITVKKNESYTFIKSWENGRESIPENLRPEKIKYEVDKAGLQYLKDYEKTVYETVSNFIDYKPGKTGFKVEKE